MKQTEKKQNGAHTERNDNGSSFENKRRTSAKTAGYSFLHPLEQFPPGGGGNCSRGWRKR